MAKSVCATIEDGNIRSALRIPLSEDKPAEDNDATYNQLIEKNSSATMNQKTPTKPDTLCKYLQINEYDVQKPFAVLLWVHQVVLMVFVYNIYQIL